MKKLFTLFVLLAMCLGASAQQKEVVDCFVDFSTVSELKIYGWGNPAGVSIKDGCLYYQSDEATENPWDVQYAPAGGFELTSGVTYTVAIELKGTPAGNIFNWAFGGVDHYGALEYTEEFSTYTCDVEVTKDESDACRVYLQHGNVVGEIWIKSIKVTHMEDLSAAKVELDIPVEIGPFSATGDASTPWENPTLSSGDPDFTSVIAWGKESQGDPHPATIENGAYVVHSTAKVADDWDNQFWIMAPTTLHEGNTFTVSFKYKADKPFTQGTQAHANPGNYNHWDLVGQVAFTTEWQTFGPKTVTISADQEGNGKGFNSLCFNLNKDGDEDNTFYFDDITVSGTASMIILQEGLFVATDKNGKPQAAEYDEDEEAYVITVGTEAEPVAAIWVSLKTGSEALFKANAPKITAEMLAENDYDWFALPTDKDDNLVFGGKQITLPEAGVWTIMYAEGQMWIYPEFDLSGDGISAVSKSSAKGSIYNLAGQKVNENYKGVVVKNGKKVVVK